MTKMRPPSRSVTPEPARAAEGDRPKGKDRLKLEITLALAFKLLVLGLLWFMFFRPDPQGPKPARGDLFSRSDSLASKENRHGDR